MTGHATFLHAILAHPEDDLPRLVYADWLEEQGRPEDMARAQFIRLEIEAERYPLGSDERARLDRQTRKLLETFRTHWLPAWPVELLQNVILRYHRGFIDDVEVPLDLFQRHAWLILESVPNTTLRLMPPVDIATIDPAALVVASDGWDRITTLQFGSMTLCLWLFADPIGLDYDIEMLGLFLSADLLSNLKTLIMDNNPLPAEVLQQFARQFPQRRHAQNLEELSLAECGITGSGAMALAAMPGLPKLKRLNLTGNSIDPTVVVALRSRFGDAVQL